MNNWFKLCFTSCESFCIYGNYTGFWLSNTLPSLLMLNHILGMILETASTQVSSSNLYGWNIMAIFVWNEHCCGQLPGQSNTWILDQFRRPSTSHWWKQPLNTRTSLERPVTRGLDLHSKGHSFYFAVIGLLFRHVSQNVPFWGYVPYFVWILVAWGVIASSKTISCQIFWKDLGVQE